jgi:polyisoprenoid-binding protein YceI
MDNHPTITFTSTKVEQAGETNFTVTGNLTIRGVTKPVTVDFKLTGAKNDPRGGFRADFEGSATINRKDWGRELEGSARGGQQECDAGVRRRRDPAVLADGRGGTTLPRAA